MDKVLQINETEAKLLRNYMYNLITNQTYIQRYWERGINCNFQLSVERISGKLVFKIKYSDANGYYGDEVICPISQLIAVGVFGDGSLGSLLAFFKNEGIAGYFFYGNYWHGKNRLDRMGSGRVTCFNRVVEYY